MRAFLQKFRSNTSSKSTTSSAYAPPSKGLEKEKKFPPLPEWPPPSLNNTNPNNLGLNGIGSGVGVGSKEPNTILSVPPTVHLTLSSNSPLTGSTFAGTLVDNFPASPAPAPAPVPASALARSAADTVPPPVTATASTAPVDTKPEDRFTRKRASTATNATSTTNQTATQEPSKKITLTKDNVTGFGRNTPTPPGNSTSNAPGAFEDRRKGLSQSDNGHTKPKAIAAHEAQIRGSTSSHTTMGTIKTYTAGAVKNLSTRALATSPTPASANHMSSVIHQPDRSHRHPPTSVGRYNTMGLPMADNVSLLRAGTPMSTRSTRTGVLTTASWSEAAEEDLVSNLGQRERTRQEVLWEIVASEQRYVHELMKLKETFIDPLLHPFAAPPMSQTSEEYYLRAESPAESMDHLPIASRFAGGIGPSSLRSVTPASPATATSGQRTNASGTPVIPTPEQGSDSEPEEYYEPGNNAGKLLGLGKGKKTSFALSSAAKANHPRSPYGTASRGSGVNGPTGAVNPRVGRIAAQFSSRSHQSLPPPPRASSAAAGAGGATSTTSLGRKSGDDRDRPATTEPSRHGHGHSHREKERAGTGGRHAHFAPSPPPGRVLKKARRDSEDGPKLVAFPGGVPPHVLPEDLRKCLEVIETGILIGHLKMSEALKKRYDEQYPLVRSLADIFVTNSEILNEYATYVLHLERALEQVDNALNMANVLKRSKQPESTDAIKVAKLLSFLDKQASERGETGLAISLSKPFQRLLKYPLLFQNLLFHTDPSTFEYESTLEMVLEVETIVRSIEDEKIEQEERDKTRDAFARLDGLERDKVLAVFKPARLLIDEKPQEGSFADTSSRSPLPPPVAGSGSKDKSVKQKASFRRISEALGSRGQKEGIGSKTDLWLVVFNDVVLLCQRIGTTTLPLATTPNARSNSMPSSEATQGKTKHTPATTGRRGTTQLRPRNLYRFLKVESWTINEKPKPRELVSKEAIERWRMQQASGHLMGDGVETEDDNGGAESDDSDRKSKMSFSYWGADKVTLTKQPMSRRGVSSTNASKTQIRTKPQAPSSFAGRQSDKESKFGTRLRSPEPSDGSAVGSVRPASRVRQAGSTVTASRRNIGSAVDSKFANGSTASFASNKPSMDTNMNVRAGATTPVGAQSTKRVRNVSITSGTPRVGNVKTLSAVPSEDSGVGMYRQIIAQDPSISSAKS